MACDGEEVQADAAKRELSFSEFFFLSPPPASPRPRSLPLSFLVFFSSPVCTVTAAMASTWLDGPAPSPRRALLPLSLALSKLGCPPGTITPLHAPLARAALAARFPSAAAPAFSSPPLGIASPATTGLTPADFLLACYYGGCLHAARRRWAPAEACWAAALTAPTGVGSAITLAAWKKWALLRCLRAAAGGGGGGGAAGITAASSAAGRGGGSRFSRTGPASLPKGTSPAVARLVRAEGGPYADFAAAIAAPPGGDAFPGLAAPAGRGGAAPGGAGSGGDAAAGVAAAHASVWAADGNAGLVASILSARAAGRPLVALGCVYAALPLATLGAKAAAALDADAAAVAGRGVSGGGGGEGGGGRRGAPAPPRRAGGFAGGGRPPLAGGSESDGDGHHAQYHHHHGDFVDEEEGDDHSDGGSEGAGAATAAAAAAAAAARPPPPPPPQPAAGAALAAAHAHPALPPDADPLTAERALVPLIGSGALGARIDGVGGGVVLFSEDGWGGGEESPAAALAAWPAHDPASAAAVLHARIRAAGALVSRLRAEDASLAADRGALVAAARSRDALLAASGRLYGSGGGGSLLMQAAMGEGLDLHDVNLLGGGDELMAGV